MGADAAATLRIASSEPSATFARSAASGPFSILRHRLEVGPRHFVQAERERKRRQPVERARQVIDCVVGNGPRAVPAFVAHLEAEIREGLLTQRHVVGYALAIHQFTARALVQRVLGIDQLAIVFQQPIHAVVRAAAFFVGSQRHDQVAIGPEAFAAVANQVGDPDGRLRLVVHGAAPVEVAILLEQRKRIHGPVRAQGLHDVDVGQQQDRLARARAAIAHHHVGLLGMAPPTKISAAGKPAAFNRAATASAIGVVVPVVNPDLLSIISL